MPCRGPRARNTSRTRTDAAWRCRDRASSAADRVPPAGGERAMPRSRSGDVLRVPGAGACGETSPLSVSVSSTYHAHNNAGSGDARRWSVASSCGSAPVRFFRPGRGARNTTRAGGLRRVFPRLDGSGQRCGRVGHRTIEGCRRPGSAPGESRRRPKFPDPQGDISKLVEKGTSLLCFGRRKSSLTPTAPVGTLSRLFYLRVPEGFPSGQRDQTVNLTA